jgi:hypothetical protein
MDKLQSLASALAYNCVRNVGFLEGLHTGVVPSSVTGDYSDVKVVTPHGEIAWNDLARISDEEMKAFMIEVTNSIYTALVDPSSLQLAPAYWAEPGVIIGGKSC